MKRCAANIILVLIMIMLLSAATATAAGNPVVSFVKVNGNKVTFPDGQPIIEAGRTLVPVRFIAEALGYMSTGYRKPRRSLLTTAKFYY